MATPQRAGWSRQPWGNVIIGLHQKAIWSDGTPTASWIVDCRLHATWNSHWISHHAWRRGQERFPFSNVQVQRSCAWASLGRFRMWLLWDGAELLSRVLQRCWVLCWRFPQLLSQVSWLLWVQEISRVWATQHISDGANQLIYAAPSRDPQKRDNKGEEAANLDPFFDLTSGFQMTTAMFWIEVFVQEWNARKMGRWFCAWRGGLIKMGVGGWGLNWGLGVGFRIQHSINCFYCVSHCVPGEHL